MKSNIFSDVAKALEKAGKEVTQEDVKLITREASKPMIQMAKELAPGKRISESIGFIEKNEKTFTKTVLIGPRYYGGHKGQLSHVFEFGTKERITKKGWSRGFIVATPFMRPAFDAHSNKIATIITEKVIKLALDKVK